MKKNSGRRKDPRIVRTLWEDLHRGNLRRTLGRDLRALYHFYLSRERKDRLGKMGRVRKSLLTAWWILESLIFKLNPLRRILLLLSIVLYVNNCRVSMGGGTVSLNLPAVSFLLLIIILLLELKDKMLARDELAAGRAVQTALIPPENPSVAGWDIWMYTRPANEVGGDCIDCFSLPSGASGIVLADVAGKGLGAALVMAKLQSTVRALADEYPAGRDLAEAVNGILCRDSLPSRFVSMVYLELSSDTGTVRYTNAGHLPPVRCGGGSVEYEGKGGPALGLSSATRYSSRTIHVEPGEYVCVYSDGIPEARNQTGAFFGEQRLRKFFSFLGGETSSAAGRGLLESVARFAGDAIPSDDLSIIIMKRPSVS